MQKNHTNHRKVNHLISHSQITIKSYTINTNTQHL